MTPAEIWLFIDAKTPEERFGNLRESELDGLYEVYQKGEFA
jgi:hypothetical protein